MLLHQYKSDRSLFANGNSTNLDTTSENDRWNYADNFLITVTPKSYKTNNSIEISSFKLQQNVPNPFNPVTNLEFGISKMRFVSLRIYDMLGKEVATVVNANLIPELTIK